MQRQDRMCFHKANTGLFSTCGLQQNVISEWINSAQTLLSCFCSRVFAATIPHRRSRLPRDRLYHTESGTDDLSFAFTIIPHTSHRINTLVAEALRYFKLDRRSNEYERYLNKMQTDSTPALLKLPDELLERIIDQLYFDIICVHKDAFDRLDCKAWFKRVLPLVHPCFYRIVAPSRLPCLRIPTSRGYSVEPERILHIASPAFSSTLTHTQHIRVYFEALTNRGGRHQPTVLYLAHIYLIILKARNLCTLELSDLVLKSEGESWQERNPPFRHFDQAKPFPFDLTCTNLIPSLPDIFHSLEKEYTRFGVPEPLQPWGHGKPERLQEEFRQAITDLKYPHLKHVLLMDGNKGVDVDDYANLFLGPDRTDTSQLATSSCGMESSNECTRATVCPALTSLTLILWYSLLEIDAVFVQAMAHLTRHHPNLTELKLVSRRLRFEPRVLGPDVTLEQWFRYDVLPPLKLAQKVIDPRVCVTFYILTTSTNVVEMHRVMADLWRDRGPVRIDLIVMDWFKPDDVFDSVMRVHKEGYRYKSLHFSTGHHRHAWFDPEQISAFLG